MHIAPTFGADDARVARLRECPRSRSSTRTATPRRRSDLKGRFFRLEDLDPGIVNERVSDDYREWAEDT